MQGKKKAPSLYVRSGDYVQVISGDDKGKRGKIVSINRKKGLVLVEGINKVKKHIKRGANPQIPQGGRVEVDGLLALIEELVVEDRGDFLTQHVVHLQRDEARRRAQARVGQDRRLGPRAAVRRRAAA